ncbi:hypothetical protein BD414DRAFT_501744 [Trametes punicea]|nr:hypothetical protein BD414DRAFT_501744 [Trametes punicea]
MSSFGWLAPRAASHAQATTQAGAWTPPALMAACTLARSAHGSTTTSNGVGSARPFSPFGLPAPAFQALLMVVEHPRATVCRHSSTVSVSRF